MSHQETGYLWRQHRLAGTRQIPQRKETAMHILTQQTLGLYQQISLPHTRFLMKAHLFHTCLLFFHQYFIFFEI